MSAFGTDNAARLAGLHDALDPLTDEVHQSLDRLRTDLQSAQLQDYTHTGETPQKKEWTYPTTLPQTEDHASMLAKIRGLPDPKAPAIANPARTPGRPPRKVASPRKMHSPSKPPSPSKSKIYTDVVGVGDGNAHGHSATGVTPGVGAGLKEVDLNIVPPSCPRAVGAEDRQALDFSKSVGSGVQQPPLKRHATTGIEGSRLPTKLGGNKGSGKAKADGWEKENHTMNVLSQSVGAGGGHGRRLRSSPQQ